METEKRSWAFLKRAYARLELAFARKRWLFTVAPPLAGFPQTDRALPPARMVAFTVCLLILFWAPEFARQGHDRYAP